MEVLVRVRIISKFPIDNIIGDATQFEWIMSCKFRYWWIYKRTKPWNWILSNEGTKFYPTSSPSREIVASEKNQKIVILPPILNRRLKHFSCCLLEKAKDLLLPKRVNYNYLWWWTWLDLCQHTVVILLIKHFIITTSPDCLGLTKENKCTL